MQQLAIVILNYNGRAHLQTFLPSVVRNLSGHTLVVIDNGSTDDSIPFLDANFPEIEVIKLPKNLGFAQGYNDGLAFLEGKYEHYLLLNSDVEVTEHYLAPLLAQLQDEKNWRCSTKNPKLYQQKAIRACRRIWRFFRPTWVSLLSRPDI